MLSTPQKFFNHPRLATRPGLAAGGLALALLSLLLAGCSKSANPGGRVHVTYWEKWTGAEEKAIRQTVDAFNRSQNRIYVDELSIAQVDRKTLLATAGGDPPDIAGLWQENMAAFSDCDALVPLDDFIRADGITPEKYMARYFPVYAGVCQMRGRIWALPTSANTYALHWNKTLFRQAGLDPERPPRTVAELDEFSDRLTKRDENGQLTQVGFLPQIPGWSAWAYPLWFGGSLFAGDQITIGTQPENLAAMQWVKGYSDRYGSDQLRAFISGGGSFASSQDPFFSGHAAMVLQGVWLNNFIRQFAPGMDYGVEAWPEAAPGVNDFTVAECDIVVIPRGAKHPREAWEFMRYLNSSNVRAQFEAELQGMEILCFGQQKSSPLRDWSPYFTEHHPNPNIALFRQLAGSPHAVHQPIMGIWQEYLREIGTMIDVVGLLVRSPGDALNDCQQRIAGSWAWHRESMDRRARLAARPPASGAGTETASRNGAHDQSPALAATTRP